MKRVARFIVKIFLRTQNYLMTRQDARLRKNIGLFPRKSGSVFQEGGFLIPYFLNTLFETKIYRLGKHFCPVCTINFQMCSFGSKILIIVQFWHRSSLSNYWIHLFYNIHKTLRLSWPVFMFNLFHFNYHDHCFTEILT